MRPYTTIYNRLQKLGVLAIIDADQDYGKSKSSGYMDLSLDVLQKCDGATVIALAHNYEQNGDLMADPDMQIAIHHETGMAEALTYQQHAIALYQQVYDQFPNPQRFSPRLKKDLNQFLSQWLKNALEQGHRFNVEAG